MARDVKVKITVEGGDQAVGEAKKVSNAFDQMAKQSARSAIDSLLRSGVKPDELVQAAQRAGKEQIRIARETARENIKAAKDALRAVEKAEADKIKAAAKVGEEQAKIAREAANANIKAAEEAYKTVVKTENQKVDAARTSAREQVQLARQVAREEERLAINSTQRREATIVGLKKVAATALLIVTALVGATSAAVVNAAKLGIDAAANLEQGVANIRSIKPDIDTSALFKSLNEMQTRVPQTADQLAESLYDVFSSIDASQAEGLQLVELFAKGAVGAMTDAKTFGTAVMGVMNAYHLSIDKAEKVSDLFFNTVKTGVVTGEQLASALGPVTASAKAAGQSIEVMFAAITAATKAGGDAAQNINNVNNLFAKLSNKETIKNFKELVKIDVSDGKGGFKQLNELVGEFIEKTKNLSEFDRAKLISNILPDAQARQALQTLIGQYDVFNASLKENQTQAGATTNAYAIMSATFNAQWQLLKNTVMATLTEIGAAILPSITPIFAKIREAVPQVINTFKEAWAELPQTTKDAFADMFSVVTDFFKRIEDFVRTNGGSYKEVIKNFLNNIAAEWQKNGSDVKGYVEAAHNVILKVNEAFLAFLSGDTKKGFEKLGEAIKLATPAIKGGLQVVIDMILSTLENSKDSLAKIGKALGQAVIEGMIQGMTDKLPTLEGIVKKIGTDGVNTSFQNAVEIKSPSRVFFRYGQFIIQGLINGLTSETPNLIDIIKKVANIAALTAQAEIASAGAKTKPDKAGVDLLKNLFGEIAQSTATTKKAQVELQLLGKEFDGLSPKLRAAIISTAEYQDKQKLLADGTQKFTEFQNSLNAAFHPTPTLLDEFIKRLKDKDFIAALDAQAAKLNTTRAALENYLRMLALAASVKDLKPDNVTLPDSPVFEIDANRQLIPDNDPTQQWFDRWEEAYKIAVEQGKRIRDELISIADSVTDIFGHALDRLFENDFKGFFQSIIQGFKEMFLNIVKDYLLSGLNKILRNLLGVGSGAENSQGSGGGILSGILGRLFGGGGRTSAPPNVGSGTSLAHGGITQNIGDIAHSVQRASLPSPETIVHSSTRNAGNSQVGSLATAGGSALSASKLSFGQQLAGLAPGLGASLGGLLGGNSVGGQILGSLGGLLGGLVLAASTGAIGGSIGGLFALSGALGPAALIAAPLLLLGAFFLGRAKQRKADEKSRDALFGDAVSQMRQLLQQVQTHNVDGASATSQAGEIYSQWYSQVLQIKTKSVRQSALNNQGPVLRNLQAQIAAAAAQQSGELALADRLRPEFATGVFLGRDDQMRDMKALLGRRRNGLLPGVFDARDNIPALLSQGEMVLNPTQQERVRSLAGFDVFSDAGIPNYPRSARPRFEDGGFVGTGITTPSNNNPQSTDKAPIYMTLSFSVDAKGMVETNIKSDSGRRIIATVVNEGIDRKEIRPT